MIIGLWSFCAVVAPAPTLYGSANVVERLLRILSPGLDLSQAHELMALYRRDTAQFRVTYAADIQVIRRNGVIMFIAILGGIWFLYG